MSKGTTHNPAARDSREPSVGAVDLTEIRRRLADSQEPTYWRSLEELAGTDEFREALDREFPALAGRFQNDFSRRNFLKVMGASLALLGINGCFRRQPQETIAPYPRAPDEIVAGRPMYFATTLPFDGYGKGVLALSREGRPIKLEGNPDHPASLGATDIFMQASLLDLYDPDRSRNVRLAGQVAQWGEFYATLRERLNEKHKGGGAGLRLLTGTVTSPTFAAQILEFQHQFPGSSWHQYDPIRSPDGGGAPGIFETPVNIVYDLTHADVIVSFANDFLYQDAGSVRYARQFINGRRVRETKKKMNRLYVAESTLSLTGSMADNRLPLRPSQIGPLVFALARKLGVTLTELPAATAISAEQEQWVETLAENLTHPHEDGASLVMAGPSQPAPVHAAVHAINQKLGNIGKTVFFIDPVEAQGGRPLGELVADMQAGAVDTLLMIGVNPAYNAPCDMPFADALKAMSQRTTGGRFVNLTAHLATHYDETSFLCQWHIPRAHWLEQWGDLRAFDGTASLIQPLIAPLFNGFSELELMEAALGRSDRPGLEIVRGHWMSKVGGADFEQWWMASLQKGVIADSTFPHREAPPLKKNVFASAPSPSPAGGFEVLFDPDPTIWNGDFANNAWLQELPKPLTKLTWDNAILISVATAEKLGGAHGILKDGHRVRVTYRGRNIEAPIVILPGQADDMLTLQLGYGRTRGGQVLLEDDKPRGYDAYRLRTSDAPWAGGGAQVVALGDVQFLAITRNHNAMSSMTGVPGIESWLKPEVIARRGSSDTDLETKNRNLIRTATLEEFQNDSRVIQNLDPSSKKPLLSLYPGWDYQHGLQWGMTIDMTACIGCNACVIACQAENNIPVVGKTEVGRQREMHWMRIDDYFGGTLESPTVFHQPVTCMHCENAPCEYVCPVGATTHSDEGLNEMTYNRCVGTRYCSNNCPYKVRRFNFFLYSDYQTPTLKLLHNPDVTVRSRGVMEKCTYCVQRIDRTRIEMETQVLELEEQARGATDEPERQRLLAQAQERGRQIVRGLKTACQQACPTVAIAFGDIRDPESEVARLKNEPTNYGLLTELTTKPRTTYLARVTNPDLLLRVKDAGGKSA